MYRISISITEVRTLNRFYGPKIPFGHGCHLRLALQDSRLRQATVTTTEETETGTFGDNEVYSNGSLIEKQVEVEMKTEW